MEHRELDALITELDALVNETSPKKGYWKEIWGVVRVIGGSFKETRYPTGEARQAAWDRFQILVQKAESRSAENEARFRQREKELERRKLRSGSARNEIEARAIASAPSGDLARALEPIAEVILLPLRLVEIALEKLLGIKEKSELEQVREELHTCSRSMREAWTAFEESKDSMLPGDRAGAYQALSCAQQQVDLAWRNWKSAKAEFRAQEQRAWEERQRQREERHRERQEKHKEYLERVRANIEKLENRLEGAHSALGRREEHLDKLRDELANAWSEGFRERCSEWIDQEEERISSIKESIEQIEGWLEEERGKLD